MQQQKQIYFYRMKTQQEELIEYITDTSVQFQNRVCKSTFESLPKIYGNRRYLNKKSKQIKSTKDAIFSRYMTDHGCIACKNNAETTKNQVLFPKSNKSVPNKKIRNRNSKQYVNLSTDIPKIETMKKMSQMPIRQLLKERVNTLQRRQKIKTEMSHHMPDDRQSHHKVLNCKKSASQEPYEIKKISELEKLLINYNKIHAEKSQTSDISKHIKLEKIEKRVQSSRQHQKSSQDDNPDNYFRSTQKYDGEKVQNKNYQYKNRNTSESDSQSFIENKRKDLHFKFRPNQFINQQEEQQSINHDYPANTNSKQKKKSEKSKEVKNQKKKSKVVQGSLMKINKKFEEESDRDNYVSKKGKVYPQKANQKSQLLQNRNGQKGKRSKELLGTGSLANKQISGPENQFQKEVKEGKQKKEGKKRKQKKEGKQRKHQEQGKQGKQVKQQKQGKEQKEEKQGKGKQVKQYKEEKQSDQRNQGKQPEFCSTQKQARYQEQNKQAQRSENKNQNSKQLQNINDSQIQAIQIRESQQSKVEVRETSRSKMSELSSRILDRKSQETNFWIINKKQHEIKKRNSRLSRASSTTSIRQCFKVPDQSQYQQFITEYTSMDSKKSHRKILKQMLNLPDFKIMKQENGVYFGEVNQDHEKHGNGVKITQNRIMEGKFRQNKLIEGIQRNFEGFYSGKFHNGLRNDYGTFEWHNGEFFQGYWKNGMKNGYGKWKSPQGYYYEGNWVDNRQEGKGVFKHRLSTYRGMFINFLKEGEGSQIFANGDTYKGQYQKGKPNGKGIYTWTKGGVYEGYFIDGMRDGYGKWTQEGVTYEGNFKNDKKHGYGKQIYNSGQSFEGQFKNGNKGQGIFRDNNQKEVMKIQDE